MPSQRLTVSVPQPCHEAWHAMSPQGQGRFCQSCSKTVTDFTAMSDAEVVKWLSQNQGTACGRFRKDQIGKELVAVTYNRKRWTWRALMLGLSAWLSTKTVEAKEYQASSIEESHSPNSIGSLYTVKDQLSSDSLKVFQGTVIDSVSKEPMPGVTVLWKGTSIGASTNEKGKFTIAIPQELQVTRKTLVVNYIGYLVQEFNWQDIVSQTNLVITLAPDTKVMGEVIVTAICVAKPEFKKPTSTPKKKKRLFR